MLPKVFDVLFGCNHQFTFPIRLPGASTPYQICVLCGTEYEYDWTRMRRLGPRKQESKADPASQIGKAA